MFYYRLKESDFKHMESVRDDRQFYLWIILIWKVRQEMRNNLPFMYTPQERDGECLIRTLFCYTGRSFTDVESLEIDLSTLLKG